MRINRIRRVDGENAWLTPAPARRELQQGIRPHQDDPAAKRGPLIICARLNPDRPDPWLLAEAAEALALLGESDDDLVRINQPARDPGAPATRTNAMQ